MSSLFPSPIGGAPLSEDFAPSIIFAVIYGMLAPIIIYRITSPKSRTLVLAGTAMFGLQRYVASYNTDVHVSLT